MNRSVACMALLLLVLGLALPVRPASASTALSDLGSCVFKSSEHVEQTAKLFQSAPGTSPVPGYRETSEYMMGKITVALVLPESNGSADSNLENWSPAREQLAIDGVQKALDWWAGQEPKAGISFLLETYRAVPTRYEPAAHGIYDDQGWISDVMSSLGYAQGDIQKKTYDFSNDLRKKNGSDWAFLIFVLKNGTNTGVTFPDSNAVGYAQLGGPYTAILYEPGGYTTARLDYVVAHEVGHVFYATHTGQGSSQVSGYLGVPPGDGNASLMTPGQFSFVLAPGTRLQVGWRDSDSDGIMDILDTDPNITLDPYPSHLVDRDSLDYTGSAFEVPYPNRNPQGTGQPVTINVIRAVRFKVDNGTLSEAHARTGTFDSPIADFSFAATGLSPGPNVIEAVAVSSSGNVSSVPGRDAVTVTGILINQSSVSRPRADAGSSQMVSFKAVFAHSGEPVTPGSLWINDTEAKLDTTGRATLTVSSDTVGKGEWKVTRAESAGLTRFIQQAPPATIIWDRAFVQSLSSSRTRADVGSSQTIVTRASLEYDGTPLDAHDEVDINGARAVFNPAAGAFSLEVLSQTVGKAEYSVTGVRQTSYGITSYAQPAPQTTAIIWDRVVVSVSSSLHRAEVEQPAPVRVAATYEYDGQPLDGEVLLDHDLVGTSVGEVDFKAGSVVDRRYGLTAFSSGNVVVVFDRIETGALTATWLPGSARISLLLRYASDGSPVENATVSLDGRPVAYAGDGRYSLTIGEWSLRGSAQIAVDQAGFSRQVVAVSFVAWGNIATLALLIIGILAGIAVVLRRGDRKATV